jgi:hypothetical protein
MNLLLFRKITIVSNLRENEIIERLSEIVDSKKRSFNFSYPDQTKKYTGKIESRRFRIYKITNGRNSFLPIIKGEIINNISKRSIVLKMRLHLLVILFLISAYGFVIYNLIVHNNYGGIVFIGLSFGMTFFFFNQECNEITKDLKNIFTD